MSGMSGLRIADVSILVLMELLREYLNAGHVWSRIADVSILVLMEITTRVEDQRDCPLPLFSVSIHVLMELLREYR